MAGLEVVVMIRTRPSDCPHVNTAAHDNTVGLSTGATERWVRKKGVLFIHLNIFIFKKNALFSHFTHIIFLLCTLSCMFMNHNCTHFLISSKFYHNCTHFLISSMFYHNCTHFLISSMFYHNCTHFLISSKFTITVHTF